jgi:drug/metabolite transporter (DMT)-like permease
MSQPRYRTPETAALAQLIVGAVLISFSPVLVNVARVGPTPAAFYRMFFSGVALAAVVVLRRRRWWAGPKHLWFAVAAGAVLALDLAVWHRSIALIGPGLSTILANFQVFFLAAFGVLVLREHPSARLKVAVPLAVAGLVLIFGLEWGALGPGYRWGIALGLFTALCYATYLLSLRRAQAEAKSLDAVSTVALLSLVSAGLLAGAVLAEGESFQIPDTETLVILLAYALVPQVAGWLLVATALPKVSASRAGLVLLLQPALAFVWDLLLFRRPTTPVELLGAAITLGAIYLGLTGRRPQPAAVSSWSGGPAPQQQSPSGPPQA